MTKAQQPVETAASAPVDNDVALTLHEFCVRLSSEDRRVELISGFESDERRHKRLKDTASAYGQRYQAFINKRA